MIKKEISIALCALTLFCGCGTDTGTAAYMGATLGSIFGSAIGGIAGGPRGSDIGTVVGMVGGTAAAAAIAQQAQNEQRTELHDRYQRIQEQKNRQQGGMYNNNGIGDDAYIRRQTDNDAAAAQEGLQASGFNPSDTGDDRLTGLTMAGPSTDRVSAPQPTTTSPQQSSIEDLAATYAYSPSLVVENARFNDANGDNIIARGEVCKIVFEVINRSTQPVLDVEPSVVEAGGNKNIVISPSIHIERIDPGRGIRYTAMVKGLKGLKNGKARFCISVLQGGKSISKVTEFDVDTKK